MSDSSNPKKIALLKQLQKETFVMIRSSSIHGIGVFALVDIPKGQRNLFSNDASEWIAITKTEMEQYPSYGEGLFSIHNEITQN